MHQVPPKDAETNDDRKALRVSELDTTSIDSLIDSCNTGCIEYLLNLRLCIRCWRCDGDKTQSHIPENTDNKEAIPK